MDVKEMNKDIGVDVVLRDVQGKIERDSYSVKVK